MMSYLTLLYLSTYLYHSIQIYISIHSTPLKDHIISMHNQCILVDMYEMWLYRV